MIDDKRIGFIGSGKMATALASGLVEAGVFTPDQVMGSDKLAEARDAFAGAVGARTTDNNAAILETCDIIVLAVKPQHADALLAEIGSGFTPRHLVISILAGVPTSRIERFLPDGCRVIRTMPNTPMLVGKGAAALCKGSHARYEDLALAREIFESAATVIVVDEPQIDAVTAVSGSGPAYFFYLVEAIIEGGIREGLPPEQAAELARQTFVGAAELLAASGRSAADLRKDVTSPGGTTQAAIESLDAAGTRRIVADAVRAAAQRSRELGAE